MPSRRSEPRKDERRSWRPNETVLMSTRRNPDPSRLGLTIWIGTTTMTMGTAIAEIVIIDGLLELGSQYHSPAPDAVSRADRIQCCPYVSNR